METGIIHLTVKHVIIRPTLTQMIKLYQRMCRNYNRPSLHIRLKTYNHFSLALLIYLAFFDNDLDVFTSKH